MRKVKLDPDELRVESFRTEEVRQARGTVDAHGYTVDPYPSCALTCSASPPPPSEDICRLRVDTMPWQCCY